MTFLTLNLHIANAYITFW